MMPGLSRRATRRPRCTASATRSTMTMSSSPSGVRPSRTPTVGRDCIPSRYSLPRIYPPVTGGAGFIGSNFTPYWLRRHPDSVVVLDALTYAGNLASLEPALTHPRLTFVQGDIRTPGLAESLLHAHAISRIVHFAAESHVDRSIAGPDPFLTTNILGTHELLKAAREVWLGEQASGDGRFLHVSTDEVYGS